MTSVARGIWALEASWTAFAKGYFRIGVSQIGMADTLAVSGNDPRWAGVFDDLSDVLDDARWHRGQINADGQVEEGTSTITVRDPDGDYNPENPTSPLAGLLGERLHPIRLRGRTEAGALQGQFYGWIRKAHWASRQRRPVTVFDCVDLFYWLGDSKPTIVATGQTTTGAAIGVVLDAVGWVDPTMRSLADGDTIPDFSADGTETALELIRDLLVAERGRFFIDGDGVATFESRHATVLRASAATIDSVMRRLDPGWDVTTVGNMITVERTGGVAQTVEDSDARLRYGDRELGKITSPYLLSDDQAASLGSWIVSQEKTPKKPIRGLDLDNRTTTLIEQLLTRDLGDVVTVAEGTLGTGPADWVIDRIDASLDDRGRLSGSWMLTKKPTGLPFQIGISEIGGAHQLAY